MWYLGVPDIARVCRKSLVENNPHSLKTETRLSNLQNQHSAEKFSFTYKV